MLGGEIADVCPMPIARRLSTKTELTKRVAYNPRAWPSPTAPWCLKISSSTAMIQLTCDAGAGLMRKSQFQNESPTFDLGGNTEIAERGHDSVADRQATFPTNNVVDWQNTPLQHYYRPELPVRLVWPWQIMFEDRGPKRVFRIHHVSESDSTGLGQ
jgi:hypothetical protein